MPTEIQFTGKERDAETGLDYFGARYLSSAQGRFASVDPKLLSPNRIMDPQQWNMYAYVRNNPLVNVDPDGKELVKVVIAGQSVVVDRTIAASVVHLVQGAAEHGIDLHLTSGFRSNKKQADMYQDWVAKGKVGYPVAKPGTSGHNSGQSVDATTGTLNKEQQKTLTKTASASGLPWAGTQDSVHFGAGFGNPISSSLMAENNANPQPTGTILAGQPQSVYISESQDQVPYSPAMPSQIKLESSPECHDEGSGCKW